MTKTHEYIKCVDVTREGIADCQHCAIRKYDFLANIEVAKYEQLLKRIVQFCYPKKSVLFLENSPADAMYVVRKGMIKLEETLSDGNPRIVRIIKRGGVAGLETFLDSGQRFDQTAITLQHTEICRIPYDVVETLLKSEPDFYKSVLKEWHQQIEASNRVIVEFSTGSLKQRLACVLLMLIEEANHNLNVELDMVHIDDMAALTGVTRESVSRILSEFKRKKILIKSGPGKMRFDEKSIQEFAKPIS
ncbi:Crp/Fnr family transcriptional regulator [Cocleimonas sp. KMM 6892]|uniref:Crp/Fnr family transcriptional regulator n=1 Tax=unclassified Cocleimonas TaxID=2639732 RepID=UPI002DB8D339|nr:MULTISPECIES: Crp/Fnr family transcriptional regulator [unclassified Cocleimonas]MEB8434464.1 Crp/Fnr family transcriptional regulator [Cocleimonas sp. KMM 6892]MEC4717357.1 Crp/Fnr family transcriptional regulator [Cocleimonas sp. KMM 6895]MEC4746736.1 Crp/Fnr family transcriptional regulator [Cocleimonas sp. KMM 6896]